MSAIAKYKALAEHAQDLRLAAENEQKMKKNAQRLHDAKMKRLEAGDKRNRRKSGFRAACRTYEAVIELLEAQYKCARIVCASQLKRKLPQRMLKFVC